MVIIDVCDYIKYNYYFFEFFDKFYINKDILRFMVYKIKFYRMFILFNYEYEKKRI